MFLLALGRESDDTIDEGVEGIIGARANSGTGKKRAAGLPDEDIADMSFLTIMEFYASVFCL